MGRVLTNNVAGSYAIEDTENNQNNIGLLAGETGADGNPISGSPVWFELEPNTFNDIGATITTVARTPISSDRQDRKGTVTDLDSAYGLESDLTLSAFRDVAEGFAFANFQGAKRVIPTAVTGSAYTIPTQTAPLVQNTLVHARAYGSTVNNGLKLVGAGATNTSIPVSGLTAEGSPPAEAEVIVAGFRSAAGDLDIAAVVSTARGSQVRITSSANVFNNEGLNLIPGMVLYFGGATAITQFAGPTNIGYVRIVSVATDGSEIVVDNTLDTWTTESNTAQTVEFYIGQFLRNVPVGDPNFLERSFQFEVASPNLGDAGQTGYEYARGNYCNSMAINLPLTDKATTTLGFIGIDTDVPTFTRKANAATPREPQQVEAINTSQDCARLRVTQIDETGLSTDFKSLTVTINNNVSPEKVLCNLGARFMNYGNLQVSIEAQLLFSEAGVVSAIRNNETVALNFAVQNDDGGIYFDFPSLTLGGGGRELPVNESVLINVTGSVFRDEVLDTSMGITVFPFLPN